MYGILISKREIMPYKDKSKAVANVKKWRQENREHYLEVERQRKRRNPEHFRELSQRWREKNLTKSRKQSLKWYYDNKDKVRVYREAHREQINKSQRGWAHRNKEYLALRRSLYRARVRKLGADLTRSQWEAIKRVYNFKCAYCGAKVKRLEKDHVIPIAKGGATTASNIVPACGKCNRRKSINEPDKIPSIRLLF